MSDPVAASLVLAGCVVVLALASTVLASLHVYGTWLPPRDK